jgi:hypothetical protein
MKQPDLESLESLAWAELQQRGSIRSYYLRDHRCFDPFVHEDIRRRRDRVS